MLDGLKCIALIVVVLVSCGGYRQFSQKSSRSFAMASTSAAAPGTEDCAANLVNPQNFISFMRVVGQLKSLKRTGWVSENRHVRWPFVEY